MNNEVILLILWILLAVLSLGLISLILILIIRNKRSDIKEVESVNEVESSIEEISPLIENQFNNINPENSLDNPFLINNSSAIKGESSEINNRNVDNKIGIDSFVNKTKKEIDEEIKKSKIEEKQRRRDEKLRKKYVPMDMNLEDTSKTVGDIKIRNHTDQTLLNPIIKDLKIPHNDQKIDEQQEEIEIIDVE